MWPDIELIWELIQIKTYWKKKKNKENSFNVNQFLDPVLYAAVHVLVLAQGDDTEASTKGRWRPHCWKLQCNIRGPSLSLLPAVLLCK